MKFERKRVESCEEPIDTKITTSKEKLVKQMADMEADWLLRFHQDLPSHIAEPLALDFQEAIQQPGDP